VDNDRPEELIFTESDNTESDVLFLPSPTSFVSDTPAQKDTGLNLEERQEETRSKLARFLIYILAGTLVGSFLLIILVIISAVVLNLQDKPVLESNSLLAKDLITFIITAQTGLIGTALGFYFGSGTNKSD
jgi:hypothetical protein